MIARPVLMLRLARRHISRRPLHSILFVIGVAMGVAVGVAIDLANNSARQAFQLSAESVSGRATHQIIGGPSGLPSDLYTRLRVELGLRASAPVVETYLATSLGGQPLHLLGIDPFAEAPFRSYLTTASIESQNQTGFDALNRFLTMPGTVLISRTLADSHGLKAGDTLLLYPNGRETPVTIVGLLSTEDALSAQALDTLLLADIATAQEILQKPGSLTRIDLILPEDADLTALRALLPPGAILTTPDAGNNTLNQMTEAFELNLRALSLLALVVGVFLIYNTVTFSVVQRRPVIGIMRSLGTTGRQIFILILSEALLLGFIGAILGLALGIIMGRAVVGLIAQTISDLYFSVTVTRIVVQPGTLLTGLAVGLLASIAAATIPSWDATRTPPAGAMRRSDVEHSARRITPLMTIGAGILTLSGILLLGAPTRSIEMGFASLFLIVIGCTLLTPLALILLMRLTAPVVERMLGVVGRIAVRDIVRSLSRTAIAVAALTIAVSVIVGVGLMISSFRLTVSDWLANTLGADIYISPPSAGGTRVIADLDPALIGRVEATEGIAEVTAVRNVNATAPEYPDLPPANISAISRDISPERRFVWNQAPASAYWAAMEAGGVIVSEPFAYRRDITPEQAAITLLTDRGPHTFPVIGVYYDYTTDQGTITMADSVYRSYFDDSSVSSLGAFITPDADLGAVIDRLREDTLAGQNLIVRSNRSLRDAAMEVFERTFAITTALQGLAIIVAFIGILSALMSLQIEHAREYAVLRAAGMTPRQVWLLILTQTGLMGGAAGLLAAPIGLILAIVLIQVINVRSFGWSMALAIAPADFAQAFIVAVLAALLAGLYPAWQLSRAVVADGLRME